MNAKHILSKFSFFIKANSPDILFGAGIIGVLAGTIVACHETTKLPVKKKNFNDLLEEIHAKNLSEKELKRELTKAFASFGFDVLKLYFPSIVIETLGIASLTGSNRILKKRSVEAAAAYAALLAAFRKYRSEVSKKIGEDAEKEIAYDLKDDISKTKEETDSPEKTANPLNAYSPFAVIFDELNTNWSKDAFERKYFLLAVQQHMNDKLNAEGHLFLNEVYKALGLPGTKAGQVYGWLRKDNPKCVGDGYVSFDIYNPEKRMNSEFVNGYEPGIVLDFNVDGDILQLTNSRRDAKLALEN